MTFKTYDEMTPEQQAAYKIGRSEEHDPRGWWGMTCWNRLSDEQQVRLLEWGGLPYGYTPEGTGCDRGAEVAIECQGDESPGPRFYCRPCGARFLASE